MILDESVTTIRGVGSEVAKKLSRLGIATVGDLLNYYPRRYDDYSNLQHISDLSVGPVTIQVALQSVSVSHKRRGLQLTEAHASDDSGSVALAWFNQPWRAQQLKKGTQYYVSGELTFARGRYSIVNPAIEEVSEFTKQTARIVPIYSETKGLSSKQIQNIVENVLIYTKHLPEDLPQWLIDEQGFFSKAKNVAELHLPSSAESLQLAQARESFLEVYALSLAGQYIKQSELSQKSFPIEFAEAEIKKQVETLPFKLTDAQRKVLWQVIKDCEHQTPMNRLVEGDVGSGKTIVAALAAMNAMLSGLQVALIAPTEILASQHVQSLKEVLGDQTNIEFLAGSTKASEKKRIKESLSTGEINLIVGTHALIQKDVFFQKLGLVIIDEQHRFGVDQRQALLKQNDNFMPHVLTMTATPIPRSLALTLYGELSLSVIDEMPPGRKPVKTSIISPNSREPMYAKVKAEIAAGRQAFIVYPLINDSDSTEAKSIEKDVAKLERLFKKDRVATLHGKMKAKEKEQIMRDYMNKQYDVLVGTTVIEVGVNVPNASVMIIEGAERFGLAQLHQLRGRVARSSHQSYCFVLTSSSSKAPQRLYEFERSTDGFALAEYDLKARGPGAIYGKRQSGVLELDHALLGDPKLIGTSQEMAEKFISLGENLVQYPRLERLVSAYMKITKLN